MVEDGLAHFTKPSLFTYFARKSSRCNRVPMNIRPSRGSEEPTYNDDCHLFMVYTSRGTTMRHCQ